MRKHISVLATDRNRMNTVEDVEREVVSLWEDLAESRGFNRVLGRVLYTLLIEAEPLSQQDLADKTGYSVPTVSRTLKALSSLGTVRKTSLPGSRLAYYYVGMQPHELLSDGLKKWLSGARAMQGRVLSLLGELKSSRAEDREKAKRLREFLVRLRESIPEMIKIVENAIEKIEKIS